MEWTVQKNTDDSVECALYKQDYFECLHRTEMVRWLLAWVFGGGLLRQAERCLDCGIGTVQKKRIAIITGVEKEQKAGGSNDGHGHKHH